MDPKLKFYNFEMFKTCPSFYFIYEGINNKGKDNKVANYTIPITFQVIL